MLVLSRKVGQEIQIGPDICLRVIKVSKDRVQLGIAAPKEISIRRKEIDAESKENPLSTWCDAIDSLSRASQSTAKAAC